MQQKLSMTKVCASGFCNILKYWHFPQCYVFDSRDPCTCLLFSFVILQFSPILSYFFANPATFLNSRVWGAPSYLEASWHQGKDVVLIDGAGFEVSLEHGKRTLSSAPPDLGFTTKQKCIEFLKFYIIRFYYPKMLMRKI